MQKYKEQKGVMVGMVSWIIQRSFYLETWV